MKTEPGTIFRTIFANLVFCSEIQIPLNAAKYSVVEVIGTYGKNGILQKNLAHVLSIECKELFTIVKHLEKLDLV